jgi:hypothetical protein
MERKIGRRKEQNMLGQLWNKNCTTIKEDFRVKSVDLYKI